MLGQTISRFVIGSRIVPPTNFVTANSLIATPSRIKTLTKCLGCWKTLSITSITNDDISFPNKEIESTQIILK